jgi:hypothetical protein
MRLVCLVGGRTVTVQPALQIVSLCWPGPVAQKWAGESAGSSGRLKSGHAVLHLVTASAATTHRSGQTQLKVCCGTLA